MTDAERTQTVAVNTQIKFKWSSTHNVWLLPNKAAYDACDFSKGTELASTGVNEYTYKASATGTVYFGCQVTGHCKFANHKLALTVTPGLHVTSAFCHEFVFLFDLIISRDILNPYQFTIRGHLLNKECNIASHNSSEGHHLEAWNDRRRADTNCGSEYSNQIQVEQHPQRVVAAKQSRVRCL